LKKEDLVAILKEYPEGTEIVLEHHHCEPNEDRRKPPRCRKVYDRLIHSYPIRINGFTVIALSSDIV